MKTKETIYTEYDARGRMIRRTSEVEVFDDESDYRPDEFVETSSLHRSSTKRINEAIDDYRMSKDW